MSRKKKEAVPSPPGPVERKHLWVEFFIKVHVPVTTPPRVHEKLSDKIYDELHELLSKKIEEYQKKGTDVSLV